MRAVMVYLGCMRSPEVVPRRYERIPLELQQLPQWVNWRIDDGRKVPVNPNTLRNAGVNWPQTWSSFSNAAAVANERELGLGFVITEDDPYSCVDLDNCIDNHGQIDDRTREILDLLAGWVELSPSETGLHIWVKNDQPVSRLVKGLEVYSYSRWMTVTGRSNPQVLLDIPNRTDEIAELFARFLPTVERSFIPPEPVPMGDDEIWSQLFTLNMVTLTQACMTAISRSVTMTIRWA